MLDKNLPITQPALLKGFGHPWHGKVQSGTLTAADGTTRAYNQPAGVGKDARYTYGATDLLRSPNSPGAGQMIANQGQQWVDYVLLAGEANQIYANSLGAGRWVYVDPDGGRWLVDCPLHGETADFASSLSATITLSRFGVIGGAAQSYDMPVSLADIGQPGPIDSQSYDWLVTSGTLSVESITSTGDRAILMLYLGVGNENEQNGYFRPMTRRPIGFLQVSITGTPGVDAAAVLTLLKNRDATLGSLGDWFDDDQYVTFTGERVSVILDETYSEETGTGYTDKIWTPVAAQYVTYNPSDPSMSPFADVYSGVGQRFQTGRIISLAFDANDQLHEWTTDTSVTHSEDAPEPRETIVGNPDRESRTRVFDDGRPNEIISTYDRVFDRTRARHTEVSFTLYRDALSVSDYALTSDEIQAVSTEQTPSQATTTWDITVAGEGGGVFADVSTVQDGFLDGGSTSLGGGFQMNGWTPGVTGGDWANFFNPGTGGDLNVYVLRYSNNLIGTIVDGPFGQPTANQHWVQSTAASPSAVHTITPRVGIEPAFYGSWNPATGEAVFAELETVCWV